MSDVLRNVRREYLYCVQHYHLALYADNTQHERRFLSSKIVALARNSEIFASYLVIATYTVSEVHATPIRVPSATALFS